LSLGRKQEELVEKKEVGEEGGESRGTASKWGTNKNGMFGVQLPWKIARRDCSRVWQLNGDEWFCRVHDISNFILDG